MGLKVPSTAKQSGRHGPQIMGFLCQGPAVPVVVSPPASLLHPGMFLNRTSAHPDGNLLATKEVVLLPLVWRQKNKVTQRGRFEP